MVRNKEIKKVFDTCHKKRNIMRKNNIWDLVTIGSYISFIIAVFKLENATTITQRNVAIVCIVCLVVAIGLLTRRITRSDLYVSRANKQIVDAVESYVLSLAYQVPNQKPKDILIKAYQKNNYLKVCFEIQYEDFYYTKYICNRINNKLSELQKEVQSITSLEMVCS